MSPTQDRQDDTPALEAAPTPSRRGLILGAVVVGVGLGAWQGAPRLAPRLAPCAAEAGPLWAALPLPFGGEDPALAAAVPDGIGEERFIQFDDLILNPAGTDGTRFLVLSLALEMRQETGPEQVRARDVEVRDAVLTLLSGKTISELSDVTARPALREELRGALNALLGDEAVARIYLPRFVIQ